VLLDEKIVAVARALEGAGIPHAFGGALALTYYATPRATHDIDLNLFVAASEVARVVEALSPLGISFGPAELQRITREGQGRAFWEGTPLDLFFSYDSLHGSCMERRRSVAFGSETLQVLSAEDLVLFKVIFDRAKDWRDVAELTFAGGEHVDWDYVRTWLGRILAPEDPRHARLEAVIASGGTRTEV
jgi:hypothetical protein